MTRIGAAAFLALGLLVLAGCGVSADLSRRAVDVAAPPPLTPEPEAGSNEIQEADGQLPNDCLACHIDKQQLIDTARPVEVHPSESSGVG